MDAQELMRILESLTPGGSEYHNNPKACAEFVRGRLATTGKIAAERNELRRQLETCQDGNVELRHTLTNRIMELERQLADSLEKRYEATKAVEIERQLVDEFATQAGLLKMQLIDAERHNEALRRQIAERDAAVLLNDTAVAAELEGAHGTGRVGVGS